MITIPVFFIIIVTIIIIIICIITSMHNRGETCVLYQLHKITAVALENPPVDHHKKLCSSELHQSCILHILLKVGALVPSGVLS